MPPVIDTNVIIHGRSDSSLRNALIVEEVREELKSKSATEKEEILDLRVETPSNEKLKEVKELSDSINSPTSKVDEKLIALAYTLEEKLLTDDKAMQNLAEKVGVEYKGYLDESIEETLEWYFRCSKCGSEISSQTQCPHCGSQDVSRKVR